MLRRKYPLQFHITFIFIVIVLFLSIALIFIQTENGKKLNDSFATSLVIKNAEIIRLAFHAKTTPVLVAIHNLAHSGFINQHQQINSHHWLNIIDNVMQFNHEILAIYAGYHDGYSIIVRNLRNKLSKKKFDAPKNAILMLEIKQIDHTQIRNFYDEQLNIIKTTHGVNHFSPSERPWYQKAPADGSIYITSPYRFAALNIMGVSFSHRLKNQNGVLALDVSLASIYQFLNTLSFYSNSQILLMDNQKRIIAHHGLAQNSHREIRNHSVFTDYIQQKSLKQTNQTVFFEGQKWRLNAVQINTQSKKLILAEAIPESILNADLIATRNKQIFYILIMALVGFMLTIWGAHKISAPLQSLQQATSHIRYFNFRKTEFPESNIQQISDLSHSLNVMSNTIDHFLKTLRKVSNSRHIDTLFDDIARQCRQIASANFVYVWTAKDHNDEEYSQVAQTPADTALPSIQINQLLSLLREKFADDHEKKHPSVITNREDIHQFTSDLSDLLQESWLFPLHNRNQACFGYVLIGFNRRLSRDEQEKIHFLQAFLDFLALIQEQQKYIAEQKRLFDSIVQMFALAIDTKSPYTGKHCQRVPKLTFLLAEAASADSTNFNDFKLTENTRQTLHLAAWLHDCGKITTPEYVVDKATKLETIYNRIHEIRTRFEVLKRDAIICYWQQKSAGGDETELQKKLNQTLNTLDHEFRFIAECNQSTETMSETSIETLKLISQRQWQPMMDNRLGLSWEETQRQESAQDEGGQWISILTDAPYHLIPWHSQQKADFAVWEFNLKIPEYQYNLGEIHNLSVRHGTLTPEERFTINKHVIETIRMLKRLPYPHYLARVPEIAGGHHETLIGTGYPYGHKQDQMSIEARIMAIADIFEALTADDRPYKKAKPLSEALNILAKMAQKQHIDPQLFRLFIIDGIYLKYAEEYLPEIQCDIDNIDINTLLQSISNKPIDTDNSNK